MRLSEAAEYAVGQQWLPAIPAEILGIPLYLKDRALYATQLAQHC